MTVVAAWHNAEGVWMAADGGTFSGNDVLSRTARKVAQRGGVLIGHSGDSRLGRAADEVAIPHNLRTLDGIRELFDGLDALMTSYGAKLDDGKHWDGVWLVGTHGRLYGGSSREPVELDRPYVAIGAGEDLACGALYVLAPDVVNGMIEPKHALEVAVKAAIEHNCKVAGQISHWFQAGRS